MRKLSPVQIKRLHNLRIIMRYLRDNQGQVYSPYTLTNILFDNMLASRMAIYLHTLSSRKKVAKFIIKRSVFYKWPYEPTKRMNSFFN